MGCSIDVTFNEAGEISDICGNTCKRGMEYARTEFTNPTRTLTTTVKLTGSKTDKLLPVKTSAPIPKGKLFEAMKLADGIQASAPIRCGEIVFPDFIEAGINLVACKTVK